MICSALIFEEHGAMEAKFYAKWEARSCWHCPRIEQRSKTLPRHAYDILLHHSGRQLWKLDGRENFKETRRRWNTSWIYITHLFVVVALEDELLGSGIQGASVEHHTDDRRQHPTQEHGEHQHRHMAHWIGTVPATEGREALDQHLLRPPSHPHPHRHHRPHHPPTCCWCCCWNFATLTILLSLFVLLPLVA